MLPMGIPAKRRRHPLGHEQRSLTGAPSSPSTRDRGHRTYGARRRLRHPSPGRCRRASCHARWWRLWLRGCRGRLQPAGLRVFGLGDTGTTEHHAREGYRPPCARSPGDSMTSSTGWATGCRPRHNPPGIGVVRGRYELATLPSAGDRSFHYR